MARKLDTHGLWNLSISTGTKKIPTKKYTYTIFDAFDSYLLGCFISTITQYFESNPGGKEGGLNCKRETYDSSRDSTKSVMIRHSLM